MGDVLGVGVRLVHVSPAPFLLCILTYYFHVSGVEAEEATFWLRTDLPAQLVVKAGLSLRPCTVPLGRSSSLLVLRNL